MTISELNCGCACIAICDAGNFIFWLNISDPADRAFLNRAVSGPECAKDGQELFELCDRFGIHMGLIAGKTDLHEVSARSQCGGPHFFTCSFDGTPLLIVKSQDLMFWVDRRTVPCPVPGNELPLRYHPGQPRTVKKGSIL